MIIACFCATMGFKTQQMRALTRLGTWDGSLAFSFCAVMMNRLVVWCCGSCGLPLLHWMQVFRICVSCLRCFGGVLPASSQGCCSCWGVVTLARCSVKVLGTGETRENGQHSSGEAKPRVGKTVGYSSWRQEHRDRYRLGRGSVVSFVQLMAFLVSFVGASSGKSSGRQGEGLMYSQAAVMPVEAAETGEAAPLVIKPSEK